MADERPLGERLLDLVVYVPVGIAAALAEELPAFAEKGRDRLGGQVQIARMVGKFTVAEAQRRVSRMSSRPTAASSHHEHAEHAEQASARSGLDPEAEPEPGMAPGVLEGAGARVEPAPSATPEVSSLPIPGYDTLAASQVVERLGSLRPDELDAVRRYEVATRGRRTILHRIGQLSPEGGRASA